MNKPVLTIAVSLSLLFLTVARNVATSQDSAQRYSTPIDPELIIVAELSRDRPYLGQQISILYSLRALRPPAAVDVAPQQYTGFWTDVVPLPEQPRTATRAIDGVVAYEFLLRQVIAYPLSEGKLEFPPLGVKIRRAEGSGDWDVVGKSKPILLTVLPLPALDGVAKASPFVGRISGQLTETEPGREVRLELQGTANLAFFRPEDWFHSLGGAPFAARLVKTENHVEIRDIVGRRQLTLMQRQQWSLRVVPKKEGSARIDDIAIPVFRADKGAWSYDDIKGITFSGLRRDSAVEEKVAVGPTRDPGFRYSWDRYRAIILSIAGLAGLAFILGWLWQSHRRKSLLQNWKEKNLQLLQKQLRTAPRSFLETAHRTLERYAEEHPATPAGGGAGETQFDHCWAQVERYRFIVGDPSAEARTEILDSLKLLLANKESSGIREKSFQGRR